MLSDSIQKSIDQLIDDVLGKEDKRQGITSTKTPSNISFLNTAIYYVGALDRAPGNTEKQLIQNAQDKLDPVIKKINEFYARDWMDYRGKVEKAKLSLFKDYDLLE